MITTIIVLLGIILGVLMYARFYVLNKQIDYLHLKKMNTLIQQFSEHKNQIGIRQLNLNSYHFQRRNLDQALKPQWEINLDSLN